MIDVETAAAPRGHSFHARALAVLVALTALSAAVAALLAVRIDQRADRAYVVASRSSVQTFTRAEFRALPRDSVELAGIRVEELRGTGQARLMGDERERHRGAAEVAAAHRLRGVVDGLMPSVESASLPDVARAILLAGDADIDSLVRDQNAAIDTLNDEGSRGDRAGLALTLMALTGAFLGLAAVIGPGGAARMVLGAAAVLLTIAIAALVTAAL